MAFYPSTRDNYRRRSSDPTTKYEFEQKNHNSPSYNFVDDVLFGEPILFNLSAGALLIFFLVILVIGLAVAALVVALS